MEMYMNGTWRASRNGKVTEVLNPTTKQVIDTVPSATEEDVEETLQAAQSAKKRVGPHAALEERRNHPSLF